MKTRRITSLLLTLCLIFGMVSVPTLTAVAEDPNIIGGELDLRNVGNISSTEYKYEWDAATNTLTLHDDARIEGNILFPDESTVKVEGAATVTGVISMSETSVISGNGAENSFLVIDRGINNRDGRHLYLTIKDTKFKITYFNNTNVNFADVLTFENVVGDIEWTSLPTAGGMELKNSKLTIGGNEYGNFNVRKIVMDKPSVIYSEYSITNYGNVEDPDPNIPPCDFSGIEDFLDDGYSVGVYYHPSFADAPVTILNEDDEPVTNFTLAYRCKLYFDTNGGDLPGGMEFEKGVYGDIINLNSASYQPTKQDYSFDGWYSDPALTSEVTSFTLLNKIDRVYAGWTQNKYTVTFNANGHGAAPADISDVVHGSTITAPTPEPSEAGWTFGGWYKEAGCTTKWDFATDTVTENMTLYAKWTQNKYTVTFNANGHGAAPADISDVVHGSTITAPTPEPSEAGWTFGGWYKEAGCTTKWDFATDTVTENMTLYGKWTQNKYTVTFNANGHGAAPADISDVVHGSTITAPAPEPSEAGWTFGGWYKEAGCTTKWDFATDTVTENTTLYGKWTQNKYTVTFNANGHGAAPADISDVVHGSTITAPTPEPSEAGWTFGGWYKEAGCTTKWDFATDTVTENTTLYAKWTQNKYTVTFNANGHGAAPADISDVVHGSTITAPTPEPSEAGWTFGGWYKEAGCTTKWDFATDTVTENTTLYAKWTQNKYTVTFNANGHGAAPADISDVVHGSTITAPTSEPSEAGWTFGGWYKEAGCTTKWDFATDTVTENTTLYAKWTQNKYTVTFNANGHDAAPADISDVVHGSTITAPTPEPSEAGWTFDGWYKEAGCTTKWDFATDTVTENTTLYAKWTQNKYTVTFNANGHGAAPADISDVVHGSTITAPTPEPSEAGWTFGGWYKEAGCTTKWDFATDTVTENTTLYGKWTQNKYIVTFNANGHGAAPADISDVVHGSTITAPTPEPSEAGWTFGGWYKEAGCTTKWDFATDTVTENTTLYGKWTQNKYIVTFNANGHGAAPADISDVVHGSTITAPTPEPSEAGWTFGGWYKEAGCTTKWDFATDTVTENTTLYAKWTEQIQEEQKPPTKPTPPTTPPDSVEPAKPDEDRTKVPNTGGEESTIPWIALFIVSIGAASVVGAWDKKKKEGKR